MKRVLRRLVPRQVRHGVSMQLAQRRSARLQRRLEALARSGRPIVAGPWLGEVGFELLYWIPFLRWFAEEFEVEPGRLVIVSRGGTWSWYEGFASRYREVFDYVGPEEFRRVHDARVRETGGQKQMGEAPFERELLDRIARRTEHSDFVTLHPSWMYEVMGPFWWQHTGEGWVHRHARYRRLVAPDRREASMPELPKAYIAVKFYFNDCFPATDENRAFVRTVVQEAAAQAPVVSLTTGLDIDDHGGCELEGYGVTTLPLHLDPRRNLHVQTAIVGGASAFVGTYGGFSYLAPFVGVPATGYFDDPGGFSARHLLMARAAFTTIGGRGDLLQVLGARSAPGAHTPEQTITHP